MVSVILDTVLITKIYKLIIQMSTTIIGNCFTCLIRLYSFELEKNHTKWKRSVRAYHIVFNINTNGTLIFFRIDVSDRLFVWRFIFITNKMNNIQWNWTFSFWNRNERNVTIVCTYRTRNILLNDWIFKTIHTVYFRWWLECIIHYECRFWLITTSTLNIIILQCQTMSMYYKCFKWNTWEILSKYKKKNNRKISKYSVLFWINIILNRHNRILFQKIVTKRNTNKTKIQNKTKNGKQSIIHNV